MKWNFEYSKQLCSLLEEYPLYYDKSHPEYRNKQLQETTWKIIAQRMTEFSKSIEVEEESRRVFDATQCSVRWKQLRDRFTKERGEKCLKSGGKFCAWDLFPYISFLNGHVERRKRSSYSLNYESSTTLDEEENTEEVEEIFDTVTDDLLPITAEEVSILNVKRPKTDKMKIKDDKAAYITSMNQMTNAFAKSVSSSAITAARNDELRSFTDCVYQQMRTLPHSKWLDCEIEIMKVIKSFKD